MASRTAIERMVPEAVAALGGLDVLVNNAGIAGPTQPVDQMPPAEWDKVVAVNLTAHVRRVAARHPASEEIEGAAASSICRRLPGEAAFRNRSPYAATKWGVIGLTKTLSMELGEWNIRANAIAPGAVGGERIERVFAGRASISGRSVEEERERAMAVQSIKGFVDPKDIAALCVFLASDAAKAISGPGHPDR